MDPSLPRGPRLEAAGQALPADSLREVTLPIRGMTCDSCVRRVQGALQGVTGVILAEVDLAASRARIRYDPAKVGIESLREAVAKAGYEVGKPTAAESARPVAGAGGPPQRSLRLPIILGLAAAAMLAGLYLGILTLAQSWSHALGLFAAQWYFVLAITAGFGVQIGLFTYLRTGFRTSHQGGSVTALAGAGTGTSTVSMLACCAHHLTDVLPFVGLSGAAIFLTDYQVPIMLLGIAANLLGIIVMLRLVRKVRRSDCPA